MPPTRKSRALTAVAEVTPAPAAPRLVDLDLDQLAAHPRNVRRDVGDVTELAASIAARGVLEPLLVAPYEAAPDGAPYVVIAGHRRLAGARLACVPTVPCIIRSDLMTDVDVITEMLIENLHRSDLTPVEEGAAYQQLELAGLTADDIADRTGRAARTVRDRIRLMDLPESTRDRLHARQITLDQATALAALADEDLAEDLYTEVEAAAGTNDWAPTLHRVTAAHIRANRAREQRATLAAAGVRVVDPKSTTDRYRMHLGQILTGHYRQPSDEEVAGHASCPGHAALDPDGYTDRTEWLCTKPDLHATATGPGSATAVEPVSSEDKVRRQEQLARQEAEWRELTEHVKAAAAAREEWVKGFTSAKGKVPAKHAAVIVSHLAHTATSTWPEPDLELWLQLLGITDAGDLEFHEMNARLEDLAGKRDPHRMLLAMLAASDQAQEPAKPYYWRDGTLTADLLPWFGLLQALGWQPSTWETERLTAALTPPQDAAEQPVETVTVAGGVL